MAHDNHYHVHSHPSLPAPPLIGPPAPPASNVPVTLQVPQDVFGSATAPVDFYSLERDLAQLRLDATAKQIISPNDTPNIGMTAGANPKPILSLVIGGNLNPAAPKVLIIGCHHAREWISVEIPYLIAEYLVGKYDTSPGVPPSDTAAPGTVSGQAQRIKHLVGNREIWFVPMLNAEGHDFTVSTSRSWRTNRFTNNFPAATTISAPQFPGSPTPGPRAIPVAAGPYIGVDINRNYNTSTWGQETWYLGGIRTSRDPRDGGDQASYSGQTFCGMSGESEAETAAIAGLIRSQQFASVISYHNYSELILAPDATFADPFTSSVGNGINSLIGERGGSYTFEKASQLYPTTGDTLDYYIEQVAGHSRPSYTIELSPPDSAPANLRFSKLPATEIPRVFGQNLAAALAAINCAGFSSAPNTTTTNFVLAIPPWVVTVVPNCWNRFKGWDPTI